MRGGGVDRCVSARSLLAVVVVFETAGAGGLLRRLDPGVTAFGLLPLLLTRSPLLFDAPPNASKAPSKAGLVVVAVSLLLAVEGTREGDPLCVRDIAAESLLWDWERQSLASYSQRQSE